MKTQEIEIKKEAYFKNMVVNNKSKRTINNYDLSINKFTKYLEVSQIQEINELNINAVLENYKTSLKDQELKDSTINQYLINLKSFFRYCNINNQIIKIKEEKNKTIKFIECNELETILKAITNSNMKQKDQYKILLKLMFFTGARVKEIEKLNIKDIGINENGQYYIILHGKGQKTVKQPLRKTNYYELMGMIQRRTMKDKNQPIFINQYGKRLKVRDIQRNFKKIGELTDQYLLNSSGAIPEPPLKDKLTPHTLRHSFAKYLLNNKKMVLNEVKELMRHENINTTDLYLKLDNNYIMNCFNNAFEN